jgi:hypothetical protein
MEQSTWEALSRLAGLEISPRLYGGSNLLTYSQYFVTGPCAEIVRSS